MTAFILAFREGDLPCKRMQSALEALSPSMGDSQKENLLQSMSVLVQVFAQELLRYEVSAKTPRSLEEIAFGGILFLVESFREAFDRETTPPQGDLQ